MDHPIASVTRLLHTYLVLHQEKKANKAAEKMEAKELLRATGPSARELELSHLNEQLKPLSLQVKDVEADGNCLYR